jgi:beta-N-acetylhexosaminidase
MLRRILHWIYCLPLREAALLALEAGCHVLLMPSSLSAAFDAVVAAVEAGSFPLEKLDSIVCKVLEFKLSHGIL